MNFLEKLDCLIEKYGLNKRTLSQKSGIPYTTIDGWYKKGYEGLKLTTLRKLNDYFNTTLDYWILDEITDPNYGKSSGFKVDYEEMEHIKKYRTLDDYGRETVDITLNRETERVKSLQEKDARITELETAPTPIIDIQPHLTDAPVRLVEYFQSASAGSGIFILGNEATEHIEIPNTPENKKVDYAIKVSGDSMIPDYNDGDIVLVSQKAEIIHGDVGIFIVNGKSFIKEYGATELISRNPAYPNIKVLPSDNIVCMGKVIGKLIF